MTFGEYSVACRFDVIGAPAPQGSKRHVGGGVMIESSKKVKPWRQDVAAEAERVSQTVGQLDGPLLLDVTFYLPMPKSRPKFWRAQQFRPHTTMPDLSKLIRSTEDALTTSGLIKDDARICEIHARKVECTDHWLGASIMLAQVVVELGAT